MHRHSSRRVPSLGKSFLAERLRGARSYDRIALLQYLTGFQHSLPTWQTDSKATALLVGALENDQ
jgi:hypothetical protein